MQSAVYSGTRNHQMIVALKLSFREDNSVGLVDPHLPPVVHHCLGQTCWEQPSANQGLQVVVWKCGGSPQTQLTESGNTCMCTCTTRAFYLYIPYLYIDS